MLLKILKWAGITVVSLLFVFVILVLSLQNRTFEAPLPQIKASSDSSIIARGQYLVYGPAHCADCHAPVGTEDAVNRGEIVDLPGGRPFPLEIGIFYSRNITPDPETGIGKWSDGELARSLRYGVGHDGRALLGIMPFTNMSDEDLMAVISYIRTIKPVRNQVPPNKFSTLGKIIKAFVLKPVGPDGTPPQTIKPDSSVAYGAYLSKSVANCYGCHTNRDLRTGAFIGEPYAGGFRLESIIDPAHFDCISPNITTDKETSRIAGWTEQQFIERFRKGKLIPHSAMAWGPFSRMSEQELKAIYRYLQTVKPVKNVIAQTLVSKG